MIYNEPQAIMDWARQVEPEGVAVSKAKLESDKFVASYLSMQCRIGHGVQDVLDKEQIDENDQ
jgi:hypothetical protein